jgi:PAS domain S-box-containing protein
MKGFRKDRKGFRKPLPDPFAGPQPQRPERYAWGHEAGIYPAERFLASLFEYSFDLIMLVGRDGTVLYVSPSAERILGYTPEEITGASMFDYIHSEDLQLAMGSYYTHAESTAFSRRVIVRVRHRDGSWRHLEAVGNNLLDDPVVQGIVISARDVTEHKSLEEGLRRSEEYFRYIAENTYDVITVVDGQGIMHYVSPSIKRVSGYDPQELTGRSVFDFVHPDDARRIAGTYAASLDIPGYVDYAEFRWLHKDGTWHIHEAVGMNAIDNPSIQGVIVHARDITEHRQREEALRESEERYRLIYDFTGEAIYTYDTRFVVIGVNKKACELIGYEEHEVLGRNILELNILHPDDYERTLNDIQRLFLGEVVSDELRFIRKDGSIAIGNVTGAPLFDSDGEVIAFTNVARDITESKKVERRLERLNRCLLGLGPDPMDNIRSVVATGAEALEDFGLLYARLDKGRLAVFSPGRTREGFVSVEEPEGYTCYGLITSGTETPFTTDSLAGTQHQLDRFALEGGFRSLLAYPIHLRGRSVGSLCLYARQAAPFTQEDMNMMGMLSRALTIEEERLAHEESIRHFVDIASHELRTPLSIIKGYAEAFQFGDLMDLNDFQMEKVRIINTKADKMAKTINDLLDLSRIERGHFAVEKQAVELAPLVHSAARQMREKGFPDQFEVTVAEGMGKRDADPDKLVDVLLILLDNAVHYSPPASPVLVEVGPYDDGVLFSILDRGAGIPEKDREMIFERFYQLEDSRHHSASGMGLGLYIAREIVRAHNGNIWHEPREGGGSAFRFFIP